MVGGDIEFIKPDTRKIPIGQFKIPWGLGALIFLPIEFLLILLALSYRRRQEHLVENWRAVKASKAFKLARKKINIAGGMKDMNESLGHISDAIIGYIADKLCIDPGAVIFDESALLLEERGVPSETMLELKKILDTIDGARFTPVAFNIVRCR